MVSRPLAAAVRRCCFVSASFGGWGGRGRATYTLRVSNLDHLVIPSLCRGRAVDEGMVPTTEVVMKHKELKETLRLVAKVLSNSGLEPGQRNQLERARRELTNIARSGKLEEGRIFRAAEIIAKVMSELVARERP